MIHDYWTNIPSSTVAYTKLADSLNKSLVLWQEAIKDYPNSARICEEYSQFLIDCATDFALGIRMKRRCDMIDSGQSFSINLALRSLVRAYPHYIKKKLDTLNVNILHDKGKHCMLPREWTLNFKTPKSRSGKLTRQLLLQIKS